MPIRALPIRGLRSQRRHRSFSPITWNLNNNSGACKDRLPLFLISYSVTEALSCVWITDGAFRITIPSVTLTQLPHKNESDTPAGVSFRQSFRHVNHIKHQETYTIRTQPPSHDLINSTFSFFFFSLSSGIYVAFWPFVGKS